MDIIGNDPDVPASMSEKTRRVTCSFEASYVPNAESWYAIKPYVDDVEFEFGQQIHSHQKLHLTAFLMDYPLLTDLFDSARRILANMNRPQLGRVQMYRAARGDPIRLWMKRNYPHMAKYVDFCVGILPGCNFPTIDKISVVTAAMTVTYNVDLWNCDVFRMADWITCNWRLFSFHLHVCGHRGLLTRKLGTRASYKDYHSINLPVRSDAAPVDGLILDPFIEIYALARYVGSVRDNSASIRKSIPMLVADTWTEFGHRPAGIGLRVGGNFGLGCAKGGPLDYFATHFDGSSLILFVRAVEADHAKPNLGGGWWYNSATPSLCPVDGHYRLDVRPPGGDACEVAYCYGDSQVGGDCPSGCPCSMGSNQEPVSARDVWTIKSHLKVLSLGSCWTGFPKPIDEIYDRCYTGPHPHEPRLRSLVDLPRLGQYCDEQFRIMDLITRVDDEYPVEWHCTAFFMSNPNWADRFLCDLLGIERPRDCKLYDKLRDGYLRQLLIAACVGRFWEDDFGYYRYQITRSNCFGAPDRGPYFARSGYVRSVDDKALCIMALCAEFKFMALNDFLPARAGAMPRLDLNHHSDICCRTPICAAKRLVYTRYWPSGSDVVSDGVPDYNTALPVDSDSSLDWLGHGYFVASYDPAYWDGCSRWLWPVAANLPDLSHLWRRVALPLPSEVHEALIDHVLLEDGSGDLSRDVVLYREEREHELYDLYCEFRSRKLCGSCVFCKTRAKLA